MKKIEPYDLMYEHVSKAQKKNHQTNETIIHKCCQQAHEWLPYEEFPIDMRKSNDKQKFTIYDIIYKKTQASINAITFVLVRVACKRETSTLISIIQNMLTYYIKYRPNTDLLKLEIMKLIYTKKSYINGITIHFALYIF
jgi:hypothetical protein